MHLMDVMTTYLYRLLDANIYIKIFKWFKMPKAYTLKHGSLYSIKLQQFLYELRQSRHIVYLLKPVFDRRRIYKSVLDLYFG